jgi:hypothetical protein
VAAPAVGQVSGQLAMTYEVFLYCVEHIEPDAEETCGHGHETLEDAWACARTFNTEDPFDVVLVDRGFILYACRREDESV